MRVTLFRLKKPKKFSIKPRHYDPVMEDLHSRVDALKAELREDEQDANAETSRVRIRKAWKTPEARKAANNTSTFRIALITAILFGAFYIYFFTDFIS